GRTWQIGLVVPFLTSNLGYAYALSERIAESLALLEPDTSFVRSQYNQRLAWLAEAYLRNGRLGEAARTAERAVEVTQGYKQRGFQAYAVRMVAATAAHVDPPDVEQAEGYYRQALALAEELGMRPLAAHCHLGLGSLFQKMGRSEPAQVELTTAAE